MHDRILRSWDTILHSWDTVLQSWDTILHSCKECPIFLHFVLNIYLFVHVYIFYFLNLRDPLSTYDRGVDLITVELYIIQIRKLEKFSF